MVVQTKIDSVLANMDAEEQLSSADTFNQDTMLREGPTEEELESHLSALPEEQQQFLAAFMTPEFAQAVGILTGNEDVFNYLTSRADNSRVLLPLPREVAEQLVGQMSSPQAQEGPPMPPEQATPMAPMPQPGGVMSSESQVM
jgi:hypothetical protein